MFIDEAYALLKADSNKDFGNDVINILVNQLDIHKHDLCVIFAGYKQEMLDFLNSNPGLKSRIPFQIEFDDYNENELYEIFNKFIENTDFRLEKGSKKLLIDYFNIVKNQKNFGNGRYVRNFYERLKIKQANRVMNDNTDINLIKKVDIKQAIKSLLEIEQQEEKPQHRRIGF